MIFVAALSENRHSLPKIELDCAVGPTSVFEVVAFGECIIGVVNCQSQESKIYEDSQRRTIFFLSLNACEAKLASCK